MNFTVPPPRTSRSEVRDRTINQLPEGELLDLFVAVLIIVPIAVFVRFL
ncbi:MAG: hypothetical protein Q8L22_11470 [Reyranella sp.]|nr:hypothetical protein [Reyranella sp.]